MKSQNGHETLLNGEVVIYQREGSRRGTYHVRFRNVQDDRKRYVRASLKTADRSLAIERAIAMYREHHSRAFIGLKSDGTSIEQLIEIAKPDFKPVDHHLVRSFYNAYWSEYMQGQDLARWDYEDVLNYFRWRIDKALSREHSPHWKASETSVSAGSLQLERTMLRRLFSEGQRRNLIARMPAFPRNMALLPRVHKLPNNKRRGRFTDAQYRVVARDFSRIRRMMNNERFQPKLDLASGKFMSWSHMNGPGSSSKRIHPSRHWLVKQTARYSKAIYWFACTLIANTGLRPAEVVKLKHSDVRLVRDSADGALYTVIRIRQDVSKVRKYRDVVARDRHVTFERYIEWRREIEYRFGKQPDPEDLLIPCQPAYHSTVKLGRYVAPNLKRIGLHSQEAKEQPGVRVFFSAYSFRAYYITKRLENGLDIYTLAKNCGVSIATLSKTYDYNENWAFRRQMTDHLRKWTVGAEPKYEISKFSEEWK